MRGVVEVSIDHTYHGLYLTPGMWFYGSMILGDTLEPVVRKLIHGQQPLASHYADFADVIHDVFVSEVDPKPGLIMVLTTMFSLALSASQINRGVRALTEVAASLYYRTKGIQETAEMPLLIPPTLDDVRIERPWEITPAVFRRIVRVDPWLSWTERLRAEFRRNARIMRSPVLKQIIDKFWTNMEIEEAALLTDPTNNDQKIVRQEQRSQRQLIQAARRSIKRAIVLHDRFNNGETVRRFIAGEPVIAPGVTYDYQMQKHSSLIQGTIIRDTDMVPLSLTILNKQQAPLATGCLVINDVSVLDYLFHVKIAAANAETEQRMLQAMFITSVTERFFADPLHLMKGITDRYTAPLHTMDTLLEFAEQSSHQESRMTLCETWAKIARQVILEAADMDENYYQEVLCVGQDRKPFQRDNFAPVLDRAIEWFATRGLNRIH